MENNTIPCGVLALHKPAGMTSHDAVNKIRRLYGTKQVGHTGTLDPDATGLLVVLVGRAAKFAEFLTADDKAYTAVMRLGATSDTGDLSGNVTLTDTPLPDESQVCAVCRDRFTGTITQVPPMYSALKVNGRKLVDLARKGITVEREGRDVVIRSLEVRRLTDCDYELKVACSKGTYIRTLCEDIGKALGCGGLMASLKRTASGAFSLDTAVDFETLEAMEQSERYQLLVGVEELFSENVGLLLPPFFAGLAHSGCEIYLKKIGDALVKTAENPLFETKAREMAFENGQLVRLYDDEGFFALAELREYEGGEAFKPVKQYRVGE